MRIVVMLRSRRVLTALGVFGAVCLVLASAAPAWAVPPAASRPGQPGQSVQSLEWWFSSWDIQTKVWPLSRGAGVTVGVVDSGVQANLPDLRAAVIPGGDTTGGRTNGMTDESGPLGHGTAVAAVIAGQGVDGGVLGIAPAAKILPVVVGAGYSELSDMTLQTVAAGIRYAAAHGAGVINLSLGLPAPSAGSCDPVLQDAVAYALEHNVVVVASAGNTNVSGQIPVEPASCAGVLAVGAVGPNLKLWQYSDQQPYVAVSAPGSDIVSLGSTGGNVIGNGTTSASAFVSGAAALIRSRHPSMPWYQVVQRIINTALPAGGSVPNDSYGYGILRIPGALNTAVYKVPASAANPVYAAYQQWLASPQGKQFTAPSRPKPRPSRKPVAAAPASSSSSAGMIAVIAGVIVLAGAGAGLSVLAARRRRHRRYT
jgi:membrane-anchored mycosin MYCP